MVVCLDSYSHEGVELQQGPLLVNEMDKSYDSVNMRKSGGSAAMLSQLLPHETIQSHFRLL